MTGVIGEAVWPDDPEPGPPDLRQDEARAALEQLFQDERDRVFYSRQLEVRFEADWFHWITNRALRELVGRGVIRNEVRPLVASGHINLMWHRGNRYYRREATKLVRLVEEYSDSNIGASLGLQGEFMVLEGFARKQFVLQGRNTRTFRDRVWTQTAHDMDFVFERDEVGYGIEVKNTLGYMDHNELLTKIDLCLNIGVRPVFVARMLPKTWTNEIVNAGGFALILKYQLYPWSHRDLARKVREELGLPVDTPKALEDGTMERFVRWHRANV